MAVTVAMLGVEGAEESSVAVAGADCRVGGAGEGEAEGGRGVGGVMVGGGIAVTGSTGWGASVVRRHRSLMVSF